MTHAALRGVATIIGFVCNDDESVIAWIGGVVLDSLDPWRLASF